jgi:pyruvate dehydrogenase E1 component beta subunit
MARMTYAQAACAAVERALRDDPSVVVLGEDVGRGGIFGQYPLAFGLGGRRWAAHILDKLWKP